MSTNSSSSCSPFDERKYAIVAGLNAASGFVSLLASSFVVLLIVLFKKWRFFTQRLVIYLAVAVAFQSVAAMISRVDYNNETSEFYVRFCQFSGFVGEYSPWTVLMSVSAITVYVFAFAVFSKRTDRFEVAYVFFIFVFPLLFNWIPFIDSSYGRSGAWCWIRNENAQCEEHVLGEVLQFVLFYIPLYVILCTLISLYVVILVKLHCFKRKTWSIRRTNEEANSQKQMSRETRSLLRYPLIYFITNLFPLSLRIYGLIETDNPSLPLWILTAIFYPIQGGFMAIAFTLDRDTRKRLRWVHIRAAAADLCQSSDKDIREYPAEDMSVSVETYGSDSEREATYHIIEHDGKGNRDYRSHWSS